MANPKNTAELAALKEKFAEADSLVLTEYRGLTVGQLQQLRGDMGFDVEYHVAKNTLIKIAANEQGIEGLDDLLTGPTAVAFIKGDAAVDAAKVMKKFNKDHDAFVIKGGYMDGNVLTLPRSTLWPRWTTARPPLPSLLAHSRALWQRQPACSRLRHPRRPALSLHCRTSRKPHKHTLTSGL